MFQEMQESWPRREYFAHYMDTPCTYSLTVNIDITTLRAALKANGLKAWPAQIYLLASAVNQFPFFRMGLSATGSPGYWEVVHPAYTVFNKEAETFASVWTPWEEDFPSFYAAVKRDISAWGKSRTLFPQADMPENSFNISSLPWLDFTAFNLNVYNEGAYLLPIFTLGRYIEEGGKTLLPLAIQVHHAACDGYHAGQFVQAVRTMAGDPQAWL